MSPVPLEGRPSLLAAPHVGPADKGLPPDPGQRRAGGRRRARAGPHTHPLVRRMMSPGWMRPPISSHTEMVMLPVLSATLQDLTSCPSFVLVTRPAGRSAAQGARGGGGRHGPATPPPPAGHAWAARGWGVPGATYRSPAQ